MIRTLALGRAWAATTSAVIIFVRLAIGTTCVGFRSHSTRPEFTSNRIPLFSGSLRLTETRWPGGASAIP